MMTGKIHEMELPITEAELEQYETGNVLIQDAFPNLNSSQREFVLSGMTDEEWDSCTKETEEGEEENTSSLIS